MPVAYCLINSNATISGVVALTKGGTIAVYANSGVGGQIFLQFGTNSGGSFERVKTAGGLDLCVISAAAGWGTAPAVTQWVKVEQSAAISSSVRSFQVVSI